MQSWLASLPDAKQQPNLVFASARWHGVAAPAPYDDLRAALLSDDGTIRATILARATQTNEAGRMATLLPALALAAERPAGGAARGRGERRDLPLPGPVGLPVVDPGRRPHAGDRRSRRCPVP